MFRRLSAWHILTASLIGLSSAACGNGAREDATSQEKTPVASAMPPSVTRAGNELTSVKPVAGEATPAEPVAEPPTKGVAKSRDEVLDQLVFEAERKPDDVGLRVRAARALLDAGKLREARAQVERAVEVDEKSASAWYTLGRVELAERDFEAAASSFQHSVENDLGNSHAWNNLGYALMEQGEFEDAIIALESATSGTGPTAYMWNNLGMSYEHVDRIREARAAYRQAAQAGSAKGQVNLERLEGVISLIPAEPAADDSIGTTGASTGQGAELLAPAADDDEPRSEDEADDDDKDDSREGASASAVTTPQEDEPGC